MSHFDRPGLLQREHESARLIAGVRCQREIEPLPFAVGHFQPCRGVCFCAVAAFQRGEQRRRFVTPNPNVAVIGFADDKTQSPAIEPLILHSPAATAVEKLNPLGLNPHERFFLSDFVTTRRFTFSHTPPHSTNRGHRRGLLKPRHLQLSVGFHFEVAKPRLRLPASQSNRTLEECFLIVDKLQNCLSIN